MRETDLLGQENKLAQEIYYSIKKTNRIEKRLLDKFINLNREEGLKTVWDIIELEENIERKKNLVKIYENDHFRYDGRLLVSAIWIVLSSNI